MAVNQKAIGCKIDLDLLNLINDFCVKTKTKKNALINKAVRLYIEKEQKNIEN